jgi:hypothetical protein
MDHLVSALPRNNAYPAGTRALHLSADRSLGGGAGSSTLAEYELADDQTQLLEAKATLALRDSVVESVVAVQPTLHAVYDAAHASPVERYTPLFLPLSTERFRDWARSLTALVCEGICYLTSSCGMQRPPERPPCAQICVPLEVDWPSFKLRVSRLATRTSN